MRASTDIPPYFLIRGDRAVKPPTNHIAANKFWREGGIPPDLALKDVLPRFTEEAIRVTRSQAKQTRH